MCAVPFYVRVKEVQQAAKSISSLSWSRIRSEKYHLTPEVLFDEIVKNVETTIQRSAAEELRRLEWLNQDNGDGGEEPVAVEHVPAPGNRADRFGCDLDQFNDLGGKRPQGWKDGSPERLWLVSALRT